MQVNVKRNVVYQNIYRVLTASLPLLTAPHISRVLGVENVGINSYVISISTFFVIFASLGIHTYGSRFIATVQDDAQKRNKVFTGILLIQVIAVFIVSLVYMFYVTYANTSHHSLLLIRGMILISLFFDRSWFLSGLEQFKAIAINGCIVKLVYVISIFTLVRNEQDLWRYVLLSSMAILFININIWLYSRKFITIVKITRDDIKQHIKPIIALFVPVFSTSTYILLGRIMLVNLACELQLGLYANAEKIYLLMIGFVIAFNEVMIPRLSALSAKGDRSETHRLQAISMKYVMMLSFALSFGIAAVARDFAPLFFGHAFYDAGILILGFSAIIPFFAFQNVISAQYLIPQKKDKLYIIAITIGTLVCVFAYLLLIPRHFAMGAIIARMLTEIIICVIVVLMARKTLPICKYIKNCFFSLCAGVSMFVLVRILSGSVGQGVAALLFQIVLGAGLYLSLCIIYLILTKDTFFINNTRKLFKR